MEIPAEVDSIVCVGSMAPRFAAYLDVMDLLVGAEDSDLDGVDVRYDYSAVYQEHEPEELFDVKPAVLPVPERARIYRTLTCEGCGESVGEAWVRLRDGKCLCLACAGEG